MLRPFGLILLVICCLHFGKTLSLERYRRDQYSDYFDGSQVVEKEINKKELENKLSDLPADGELFEGDMLMDSRLRNAVLGISKKTAISGETFKWPNGILYYHVEPDFTSNDLLEIAITEFERRTCIRFQKRINETDYVLYSSKEDVCSSNIGRRGGKQVIHIGIHCRVLGTVEHETMHTLGFIHEHSRPDRDDFLNVKWDNIKKKEWNNFNKYQFGDVNNEGVDYNFASVMHYRNDAFTSHGFDTLVAKDEPDLKFGQRIKFSVGDVKGINVLYDCKNEMQYPDYRGLFKDYSGLKNVISKREIRNLLQLKKYLNKL